MGLRDGNSVVGVVGRLCGPFRRRNHRRGRLDPLENPTPRICGRHEWLGQSGRLALVARGRFHQWHPFRPRSCVPLGTGSRVGGRVASQRHRGAPGTRARCGGAEERPTLLRRSAGHRRPRGQARWAFGGRVADHGHRPGWPTGPEGEGQPCPHADRLCRIALFQGVLGLGSSGPTGACGPGCDTDPGQRHRWS